MIAAPQNNESAPARCLTRDNVDEQIAISRLILHLYAVFGEACETIVRFSKRIAHAQYSIQALIDLS
jgi:hypothetical protein